MIGFVGCSFTAGHGWGGTDTKENKSSPYLWTNICCAEIPQLKNLSSFNLSKGGSSNTDIFEQAVNAIATHGTKLKYLFCQWTSAPRYTFSPGLDHWLGDFQINPHVARRFKVDLNLSSGVSWSKEYLNDLVDRFLVMHHLHFEIVKIVRYINIINSLAKPNGTTVVFINGLCPWDDQYFTKLSGNTISPSDYTDFTKDEILDVDRRDDQEIFRLYDQVHQDYSLAGGIHSEKWINLYKSWKHSQVDTNDDKLHPGISSNKNQASQIKEHFIKY